MSKFLKVSIFARTIKIHYPDILLQINLGLNIVRHAHSTRP